MSKANVFTTGLRTNAQYIRAARRVFARMAPFDPITLREAVATQPWGPGVASVAAALRVIHRANQLNVLSYLAPRNMQRLQRHRLVMCAHTGVYARTRAHTSRDMCRCKRCMLQDCIYVIYINELEDENLQRRTKCRCTGVADARVEAVRPASEGLRDRWSKGRRDGSGQGRSAGRDRAGSIENGRKWGASRDISGGAAAGAGAAPGRRAGGASEQYQWVNWRAIGASARSVAAHSAIHQWVQWVGACRALVGETGVRGLGGAFSAGRPPLPGRGVPPADPARPLSPPTGSISELAPVRLPPARRERRFRIAQSGPGMQSRSRVSGRGPCTGGRVNAEARP